jgi:decaprenylphospho-beta-D-erythro-pentofuranosid-2-ulose 2-reductase
VNDAFNQPQSVVVLGGTSDIARAIVAELAARRCRTVVLAGRDPARLAEAEAEARKAGADTVRTTELEATDPAAAPEVVDRCFELAGSVDLVIVAVGLLGDQEHDEHDPAAATDVATVNYTWPAAALLATAERLRRQGHGRIVVLSSVAGVRVRRANFIYGAAKSGLDGFAVGLGESLRGSGVSVQVVRPGFVHSKMTEGMKPAPFATTPEAVASAVVQGIERGADSVWVPSVLRWVFLILANLPQALWRRMPG